ncbi:MAG TPA: hypothetical protein VM491_04535 [Burkholderiaceae bacterium]|nr:hypothetical protein [Burkholderiaceae bacterium]
MFTRNRPRSAAEADVTDRSLVEPEQHVAAARIERRALFGQRQAARRSRQQPHAQLALELADRLADG